MSIPIVLSHSQDVDKSVSNTMSVDDGYLTLCVTFLGFIILLASNSVSYISWPGRLSIG